MKPSIESVKMSAYAIAEHADTPNKHAIIAEALRDIEKMYKDGEISAEVRYEIVSILLGQS